MWFKLKATLIWFLSNRRLVRRQCVELRREVKRLRGELLLKDERAWKAERAQLSAEGARDAAYEMWQVEGSKWLEHIDKTVQWMGRVGVGFGPGDDIPTPEPPSEKPVTSRPVMNSRDALREMMDKYGSQ